MPRPAARSRARSPHRGAPSICKPTEGKHSVTSHPMTPAALRFSDRVENYVRYRPGYPEGVLAALRQEAALKPRSVVADVGSGTGISTELFLKHGHVVYAVEPNDEMRHAAERLLAHYPNFR